nr:AAA1 variant VI [Homo sapiens]
MPLDLMLERLKTLGDYWKAYVRRNAGRQFSHCNLHAHQFLVRRKQDWQRLLPPLSCQVGSPGCSARKRSHVQEH